MADRAEDRLAEELAALRRVATLVAAGAQPELVFATVTAEAGRLLGVEVVLVERFDPADEATVVAHWAATNSTALIPVGSRFPLGGWNVATQVLEAGRPARIDNYATASGAMADLARAYDVRSTVGAPITVEGRPWGVMLAAARDEPLPAATEARLAGFAELVATAVASAQARAELRGFAEEQAALRRVATLVAEGRMAAELFAAVAAEVGRVFGCDFAVMSHYGPDDTATIVGQWTAPGAPVPLAVGQRFPLGDRNLHTLVARTHRPARLDGYGPDAGAALAAALATGLRSAVGVPIDVDAQLWGVMLVASQTVPLPADSEMRLAGFTELVATAIANADARAALTASRARIVATADATRRRFERDLHDGAQQRLVSLALQLRTAQAAMPPEKAAELDAVAAGLGTALDELREIARGIHPAALADGGLRRALKTLARRSAVPVRLDVQLDRQLPDSVELAAFYTVSELLTNAAKHAQATVVDIRVDAGDRALHIDVRDDGRGGADLAGGTGLIGLKDRIEALGGQLTVHSPPGAGTTLTITLPLAPPGNPQTPRPRPGKSREPADPEPSGLSGKRVQGTPERAP